MEEIWRIVVGFASLLVVEGGADGMPDFGYEHMTVVRCNSWLQTLRDGDSVDNV